MRKIRMLHLFRTISHLYVDRKKLIHSVESMCVTTKLKERQERESKQWYTYLAHGKVDDERDNQQQKHQAGDLKIGAAAKVASHSM
jgi:hypothetical protein